MSRLLTVSGEFLALEGIGWKKYRLLARLLEDQNVRMTYLDGRLEIVSPSPGHEQAKEKFAQVIRVLAEALKLPYTGYGSTTFRRRNRWAGKEPDTCFYLRDSARLMYGRSRVSLRTDPPPDLAVEVVGTHRDTVALETYERLRVPELWWYEEQSLTIYRLGPGDRYAEHPESGLLPGLRAASVEEWIEIEATDELDWKTKVEVPIEVEAARLRALWGTP